jgi:CMP-N-acetylneuraminic acid synthetase
VNPHIVGIIFARGGSKGVRHKNIRLLAGKPLLAYSIEVARKVDAIERVVVSTDDPEVATVARDWGAEVPFMRPAELARDDSPEWLSWQHAIRTLETPPGGRAVDVMVSIPTTSPLRAPADVQRCLDTLLEGDADAVVTISPAAKNPYFNMVVLENGLVRRAIAGEAAYRRQDAPAVFDLTTVAYAVRGEFVLRSKGLFDGKLRAVVVPRERALDIDSELDVEFAEFMLARS